VNDAERRRSPDGFDDDAIFADIVAHLNDDAAEAGQPDRSSAEDAPPGVADAAAGIEDAPPDVGAAAPDIETADQDSDDPSPGATNDPAPDNAPDEPSPGPPGFWSINLPAGPPLPIDPPADSAPQVWRAHEVDDEDEEHFEPPPVTPLPAGDLQFWAIIAGMTCGPLLLLYLVFFNRDASSYWILIAIGLSVGGFAMLVSRMPGRDDDDDDGARL
jgi:hypothetical protein